MLSCVSSSLPCWLTPQQRASSIGKAISKWSGPRRVAKGQDYEVRYEAKKTGRSASAVKKAVKKVGNSRKRVEKRLGR